MTTRIIFTTLTIFGLLASCNSQTKDTETKSELIEKAFQQWVKNPSFSNDQLDTSVLKNLRDSGQIVNGNKQGLWIEYSIDTSSLGKEYEISVGDKKVPMTLSVTLQKEIGNYIDGKKDGTWILYNSSDKKLPIYWQKLLVTNYKLGLKNGKEIILSFLDTIMVRTFVNGQEEGLGKIFDINNSHKLQKIYNAANGQLWLLEEYYPSGQLKSKYTDTTINGRPLKKFKTYYDTGHLESEGIFNNDKLDGNYKYYHDNGQLWIEEIFKDGNILEVISNFDSKGKKKDKGTLKNGSGTIILYDNDGKILRTEKFVNGQKI